MAADPNAAAARWAQNLQAATSKMTEGANGVNVSPGQLAAKQADVWLQNTTASAAKYKRNVAGVTLQDWQQAFITKGIPRIASGATAAQPKMAAFLTSFIPFLEQGRAALPPRGNFEANLARSAAMIRHTHGYKKP